jgi:transcription elongation GreA/GreB family factor
MNNESNGGEYQANDADGLVTAIFSGGITVGEAIERLRTRLLDLSARNRLLNYRHPKGRCIQIAGEPNINLVFDRLYFDGRAVRVKYVPDPPTDTYDGKRPEARLWAPHVGISTAFEFEPNPAGSNGRRLHAIQSLLYPADLERQLRKISSEAKTAIEETGTNMLFLIFGFLEFYDSEDSERPMLAPLLSLPVTLLRGEIDQETRTYQYAVQHSGEDLTENHTLREKLRRDFMLSIPEFEEDDEPESYFAHIERTVKSKRRWKVRRQITLGTLSFGKLAIWADLDTKKNPNLTEHDLIKSVFSGGSGGEGGLHAEDYRIDERPEATQPLIYDADSSQHSAIIDVLSGKNLVINGPPGTGKSQTITNIIAASIVKGKTVLFVSEKLAALEVVRSRLNHAGLGDFCLELHSHNTQKKKFLEDIRARIDRRFPAPAQFQAKLALLHRQKTALARHAELMGSSVANALGLTVNEVFWAAERRRQELGDLFPKVNGLGLADVSDWTNDQIESHRSRLAGLAELYDVVGGFGADNLWWGFRPDPLAPSDDETIARTVREALAHARKADAAAKEAVAFSGLGGQPDMAATAKVRIALDRAPPAPEGADAGVLARMFDAGSDPKGKNSSRLLAEIVAGITKARTLSGAVTQFLIEGKRLRKDEAEDARRLSERHRLSPSLLAAAIQDALEAVCGFENSLKVFEASAGTPGAPYGPTDSAAMDAFLTNCGRSGVSGLAPFPIRSIATRALAVVETTKGLAQAVSRVGAIAGRHGLLFDSTPDAVAQLADHNGPQGLKLNAQIDPGSLAEARQLAADPLSAKPTTEIGRLKSLLETEITAWSDALARCRMGIEPLGIAFDSTENAVAEAAALAKIAATAPEDLLDYRRPTFGHPRVAEFIDKTRSALAAEREAKASLEPFFYLDALPGAAEIKSAVAALRQNTGPFALFDGGWRKARSLHAGISKEKRRVSASQRAVELARLASWIEARELFTSDNELKECFGALFRGLETDPDKIARLNDWYLSSRATLFECRGLADKVDLTAIPSNRISELGAFAASVKTAAENLAGVDTTVREIIGADLDGFREAKASNWEGGLAVLRQVVDRLASTIAFFGERADANLSPKDALRLMEARAELDGAAPDLAALMQGEQTLREAGGEELGGLAELVGARWSEVIPTIAAQASLAAEIASQAAAFGDEDSALSYAEAFAKGKLELDMAWSAVAALPAWNRFDSWRGLANSAGQDAAAARTVLERVGGVARYGVSSTQVFDAMDKEMEARSIIESMSERGEVHRMLGDAFDGADTDLDRLSRIHGWGDALWTLELPAEVRKRLMSEDASYALDAARRIYAAMDDDCATAKELMESLASYGSFSWDDWQKQARSEAGRDLPSEMVARLELVARLPGSVLPWSQYLSLRLQARGEGLTDFASALESKKLPSAALALGFEQAVYQSIGRSIFRSFPELSQFSGSTHERTRSDYRGLDAEIVSLTGKDFGNRIARRTQVPEGQHGTTVGDYTELNLLRREINKKRRHIPIRQLVKRAGNALQALKPCFMMGPLSVAQYLEQGTLKFDLIVMDEASQLRPEEALGAVARGSQLVVVGDPKQLPPTNFFDRMLDSGDEEDEDNAPAATSGMESILDICQQLFTPVRSLRWHYRSQHESLIAFSNHHFYKNLVVFPSPYSKKSSLGVKYRYVRGGIYRDRQNLPEAQRLVDAVLEHMIKRPDESLGVVTLNQTQRELIEELLDKKLKAFNEGANFIGRWEAEGWPFFIKNLENVQGDERDVILISTTFGKAPGTDKVRQNFGPISRPDGWRRLNVLFTRSKRRIELFTSMTPEDIVVDERTPLGTKALRDYLDFAKRGVLVTTDEGERPPDSDFEVSVANVITALGYEVKPQLGVAGFFIDMAVRNPDRPGEFLVGIECDGATYHSGFSVRDRDRIRQEILESLGWKGRIYRIWSTDWFYNPRRETARLRSFLEERRRLSAADDPSDWEEIDLDEVAENRAEEEVAVELAEASSTAASDGEDLFVEVGDRVTYCPVDAPNDRHAVLIVDSQSNAKRGVINEETPVARALLGLSPGDVGELEIGGRKNRQLRVLKVQRHEELVG